jgi:hypothetical protein
MPQRNVTFVTASHGGRMVKSQSEAGKAGGVGDGRRISAMESVMNGFERDAEFYRGYLPAHRSVFSMAITLAMIAAIWLLVYLVAAIGPAPPPTQPYSGLLAGQVSSPAVKAAER